MNSRRLAPIVGLLSALSIIAIGFAARHFSGNGEPVSTTDTGSTAVATVHRAHWTKIDKDGVYILRITMDTDSTLVCVEDYLLHTDSFAMSCNWQDYNRRVTR